jgi:hypothetical protein
MTIRIEPVLFTPDKIRHIEQIKKAKYVCATEHKGKCVEVFYADVEHSDSKSRYFALYVDSYTNNLMITNGAFIEDQIISAVLADNGDIVYSRYRHDFVRSEDESVWIDGGREYTRSGLFEKRRYLSLVVRDGVLQVYDDSDLVFEQNDGGAPNIKKGDQVSLTWEPQFTFALNGE